MKLAIALTNAHIIWNCLRSSDGVFFSTVASRLFFIGESLIKNRSSTQHDSPLRRRVRLSSRLAIADSIDEAEKGF